MSALPQQPAASTSAGDAQRVEARNCPVCGAAGGAELLTHDRWRLVACQTCGLAYLPEHPSDEAVDTDFEWSESFARERAERWARNPLARAWTMFVLFLKPSREQRALRWIRQFAPRGRMIDVGCGDGRLLALAQRRGFDVLGVESSPQMAARARRRIGNERVLCGRLADFPLEAGSFDLAVTVSYLEHEPRPAAVCARLFTLLRPGGICIHKVPNYDSWLRRMMGARWSGYRWPEHVQYFTPATLGRLLTDCGFEVLAVSANRLGDNFWIAARKPGGS